MVKLYVLLLCLSASVAIAAQSENAVVVVPVADVWSRPLAAQEKPTDELRETQVLYGEQVIIHGSSGAWANIEAVEQPTFRQHNRWEGYPGWVRRSSIDDALHKSNWTLRDKLWNFVPREKWALPLGARILMSIRSAPVYKPISESGMDILATSNLFMGVPYLWGGLSSPIHPRSLNDARSAMNYDPNMDYGIDCSGLVHLAYRVNYGVVPRDSHEQWMKAKPITRAQLKPADLIFSAKAENPKKITHVALYIRDGQIIEAPQAGMAVRQISFQDKYGKPLDQVESGDHVGDRYIYFGSFLH